jgi:small subunit ribosomal protein S8e
MRIERKISGGKYKSSRKKKKYELTGQTRVVRLGEKRTKLIRTMGGHKKLVSLSQNKINLVSKNGKAKVASIKNVLETSSNRFLARQNVLVKGAIIETSLGKAKITNRPGQEGQVQGVLVD